MTIELRPLGVRCILGTVYLYQDPYTYQDQMRKDKSNKDFKYLLRVKNYRSLEQ